ncbi:hypothetical protein [Sulfitobacter dubius]|uniref:hypothetical protein n=1 Tax=Sulfitobacter dubius TaxID=218673 RepID=UPI0008EA6DE0|nr:hypothetical protein [Sulfitobacter dubius]SFH13719.1 hypothetical protein SAMN04488039_103248 [Sulfitobacter dubius]
MTTLVWLRPGIYGALIGAVLASIVGFTWGGWVTDGTAVARARVLSHNNVVASMVPVCLYLAEGDPDRSTKLATIRAAPSVRKRDALMAFGWATVPGTDTPDQDLANGCLAALDIDRRSPDAINALADGG